MKKKNILIIAAAPHFTIPLGDRHMDKGADLTWTCEAFGIPDVSYQWYRNGQYLARETLPPPDIGRYYIQDNVLTIRTLDEERDAGVYQCRANNSLAAKFSSGQLRILCKYCVSRIFCISTFYYKNCNFIYF